MDQQGFFLRIHLEETKIIAHLVIISPLYLFSFTVQQHYIIEGSPTMTKTPKLLIHN